jgi:hypothetical protein
VRGTAPVRGAALVLTMVAAVAGAAGATSLGPVPEAARHARADDSATDVLVIEASLRELAVRSAEERWLAAAAEDRTRAEAARAEEARRVASRVAMWDRLAQCETHGNWHDRGDYGGGLGIYVGTWRQYGGEVFAARPQWATKAQQIVIAERIALDGFGGWGCAEAVGLVR